MTRTELARAIEGASSVAVRLDGRVRGSLVVTAPSVDARGVLRGHARGLVLDAGRLRRSDHCALLAADVVHVARLDAPDEPAALLASTITRPRREGTDDR